MIRPRIAAAARRFFSPVEPWYDWGIIEVDRMEGMTSSCAWPGPVRYFELQWLGLHIGFQIGRTPRKGRR